MQKSVSNWKFVKFKIMKTFLRRAANPSIECKHHFDSHRRVVCYPKWFWFEKKKLWRLHCLWRAWVMHQNQFLGITVVVFGLWWADLEDSKQIENSEKPRAQTVIYSLSCHNIQNSGEKKTSSKVNWNSRIEYTLTCKAREEVDGQKKVPSKTNWTLSVIQCSLLLAQWVEWEG